MKIQLEKIKEIEAKLHNSWKQESSILKSLYWYFKISLRKKIKIKVMQLTGILKKVAGPY